MTLVYLRLLFAALVGYPSFLWGFSSHQDNQQPSIAKPRLVVFMVIDQFRGDYPTRWKDLFGEGGFKRLMKEGTWFSNCHFPYAITVTGTGHASLATGCEPYRHGIIENDWYDRTTKSPVYCAKKPEYRKVGAANGLEKKEVGYGSPERLLVPTLADAWKISAGNKGKVVSLALKDRACVFTGGKRPDGCYWFDDQTGFFVTSTYYGAEVAPWVAQFNAGRPADAWFGKDWVRFRSDIDYAKLSGTDDQEGESSGEKQGRTFPHPMTGGLSKPGGKYYEALYTSPYGNDLLLQFVKQAIDAERLGQHELTDLLCVSFSANDPVGHAWGPDSQEVLDTTLRTDALLAALLQFLDEKVGKGRYLLVLTADHGVCPLPEVSQQKGMQVVRLQPAAVAAQAETFLQGKYGLPKDGKSKYIENVNWPMFYLHRQRLTEQGVEEGQAETALAEWLEKQPGILKVYTRRQLTTRMPGGEMMGRIVQNSFHLERSGDLLIILQPYCFCSKYLTGTGHGTPHSYDTHVPLIIFGNGVPAQGERKGRVSPLIAPRILAQVLGVDLPFATAELPVNFFPAPTK